MNKTKQDRFMLKNLGCLIVLLTASFTSSYVFAQGSQHTETWNFGKRCRLTFDGNTVVPERDPKINVKEGSASFSDPGTGELIAYSDGTSVWSATGDVIVDDLPSGPSALHGPVIVPRPLSAGRMYVISHPFESSAAISVREFNVSDRENIVPVGDNVTIDIDGGLATAREGMLVVPHQNGLDYWVIVSGDQAIFVLSVTSEGLGAPKKYLTGLQMIAFSMFAISNSGTTLVISDADTESNTIYALTFDPSTGEIAGEGDVAEKKELFTNTEMNKYGGAFSPDDSKLYYSTLGLDGQDPEVPSSIFQYDFTEDVDTLIDRNRLGYYHAQSKLAQNGKIYITTGRSDESILSVIDNPNDKAADITLGTVMMDSGCDPNLGLPQTIGALATVTLGIEFSQPRDLVGESMITPSGTANLPDGTTLTITVSGAGGEDQTCEAVVQAGRWSCPEGAITDLVAGEEYKILATDGTVNAESTFVRGDCKQGDACDVNECELGTDNCSADATCTDTLNGFSCECNAPLIGNGFTCAPPGVVEPDMGTTDMGTADMGTGNTTSGTGSLLVQGGCSSTPQSGLSTWWLLALALIGFRRRK